MTDPIASDQEFHKVCLGQEPSDFPRLMLEIASDAHPDLEINRCLAEIESLGQQASQHLQAAGADGLPIIDQLRLLSEFFCFVEGFRGNEEDYYDPENSYLDSVLHRRVGIPITLCMLYVCIGRQCGLPLSGVCSPAHFVVRCDTDGEPLYVDVFHGGDVLTMSECAERIEQLLGESGVICPQHLQAAGTGEILVRMLRNLKACYIYAHDWQNGLLVQQRLVQLLPDTPAEERDLGLIYLHNYQPFQALRYLSGYMEICDEVERAALEPYLLRARRNLAEFN